NYATMVGRGSDEVARYRNWWPWLALPLRTQNFYSRHRFTLRRRSPRISVSLERKLLPEETEHLTRRLKMLPQPIFPPTRTFPALSDHLNPVLVSASSRFWVILASFCERQEALPFIDGWPPGLACARVGFTPAVQEESVVGSEIIDIRHFELSAFSELLEAESRAWNEELYWDFTSSARVISNCLQEKRLAGYALVLDGVVRGYCFFFCDGEKG